MCTKYTDASVLQRQRVWALLTYKDNSQFCFETTLCPAILNELGIILEEGKLPRLDKKYYIDGQFIYRQFPYETAKVSLWNQLHYTQPAPFHEFL